LEKEKTQVLYESLKQQLNPHFLFNSLSSLRSLIRMNPALATDFLDGLSKTYRYLLRSGDSELVLLSEEINFVQTFIQLQKTRFDEGLQLKIELSEELMNKQIAPVTIQGLIENAIKHNTIGDDAPLVIEVTGEANDYIVVRNNLQRYRSVETSNKKGLEALKTLYRYLTDKPVLVEEDAEYFSVKIPLV
jgi:LytS/YehU family sensor histidine kinase